MEILFISHKYPPAIGGMEKHAFELFTRLDKQHTLHPLIYDNEEGRFRFFRLLKSRVQIILNNHPSIELIYVNEGLLACFAAQLKKITTIPIVATVHGLEVVFPNFFYQKIAIQQLKKLDGLIAVSRATQLACIERGIPKRKVFVVNNGVDHDLANVIIEPNSLSNFQKKHHLNLNQKRVLITMGRPVKRKGFSWFVKKVMPELSDDTILLLIGPRKGKESWFWSILPKFIQHQLALAFSMSSDEMALKQAIALPKNTNRIFELGKLPFPLVLQLLKIADLFIMPNIKVQGDMEGFGLVALEAAISGTPVAASSIEGITDAVQNGKNGYLLPTQSSEIWIKKINQLLLDKQTLAEFGQTVKDYTLHKFSWSKMAVGYNDVFNKIGQLSVLKPT